MPYSEGPDRPRRRRPHHGDADVAARPRRARLFADRLPVLRYPGGNELRQTGDPAEQRRDLVASFETTAGAARLGGVPGRRGGRDHAPQELRRHRLVHRRGPAPRPRPARASPASSSSTPSTTAGCTTGSTAATPTSPTPPPRRTTGACSSSAPSTPACCPRCYVPLADPEHAVATAPRTPSSEGAAALLVASGCPPRFSPSHRDLVRRLGAGRRKPASPSSSTSAAPATSIDPNYFVNGLPVPPDFHGGEENFRSVDYMGIPVPPAQTLATMIFDGVLERFPDLRIGVIEQGAIWVPSWLRQMESAFEAFHRHEERLQALSLRPSDYVHRQVRFTPYPTEDVGWIIEQARRRARACSPRTTRTSKAAASRSSASRRRSATPARGAPALLLRQLPVPDGRAPPPRWPPERMATRDRKAAMGRSAGTSSPASKRSRTRSPTTSRRAARSAPRSACTWAAARSSTLTAAPSTGRERGPTTDDPPAGLLLHQGGHRGVRQPAGAAGPARPRRARGHLLARVRTGGQGGHARSASCSPTRPDCRRSTPR